MSDEEAAKDEAHRQAMIALKAQQDEARRARKETRGLLIVHTGDGKGKSTASFGLAMRAAGHGKRVALVQFTKGSWKTGEQAALRRFPEIEHHIVGDGFTWETQNRQADMARARAGWTLCKALVDACRGEALAYELVIMDELHIVLRYDYLPTDEIVAFLATKPRDLHICTTGRDAPQALIDIADTVTEMRAVKHAYDAGVKAQKGVEF